MGESTGLSQVWKTEISELGLLLTLWEVWDEGSGQVGGGFVFGFPGIAVKDELQGNFGKKKPQKHL